MPALSALTCFVPDLDAATTFYCDVLGFTVKTRFGPDVVQLAHDGIALVLCRCERPARPEYPSTAQVTPGFAVTDAAAELARLRGLGADLVFDAPQEFPLGRFIVVRDPAGNAIELLEYRR